MLGLFFFFLAVWNIYIYGRGTYSRHHGNDKTTPSAKDSRNTDEQFDTGCDKSHDEGDEHPASDLLVGAETLIEATGQELVALVVILDQLVQTPYGHGVEPVFILAIGAFDDLGLAVYVLAVAVVPEADKVEVVQSALAISLLEAAGEREEFIWDAS